MFPLDNFDEGWMHGDDEKTFFWSTQFTAAARSFVDADRKVI